MTLGHPMLDRLDAALVDAVPTAPIAVRGDWTSRSRRSYETKEQLGSGRGPYVEVVDHVWNGHLSGTVPFTGMAFLHTETGVHWAKAAHLSQELNVSVSLHGPTGHEADRLTFAAGLDDAYLPAVPIEATFKHRAECLNATGTIPIGRVACLARAGGAAFLVLLLANSSVEFGRNRLWRLRDAVASGLPPDVGELLTRRRAGVLRLHPLASPSA